MPRYRPVDIERDREVLLEFHCEANYESETSWAHRVPYDAYRAMWFSTSQPETYLHDLGRTVRDGTGIAHVLVDEETVQGSVWMGFTDIPGYGLTVAEIHDLAVHRDHRRQGLGLELLRHAEEVARERGAHVIRSDAGVENLASQRLHEKAGYAIYRVHYEKVLGDLPM